MSASPTKIASNDADLIRGAFAEADRWLAAGRDPSETAGTGIPSGSSSAEGTSTDSSATARTGNPSGSPSADSDPPQSWKLANSPLPFVPGFSLIRETHRGGQGIVYEAVQLSTDRIVAVKFMLAGPLAGAIDRTRFDREVRILARLQHPGIVNIYDTGVAGGCRYFVMDYIAGQPIDEYVQSARLDTRATLELFARVCDIVFAAHVRGFIHRDLKPSHILIDDDGQPHIVDFGLGKIIEPDASCQLSVASSQPTASSSPPELAGTGVPSGSPAVSGNWKLETGDCTADRTQTGQFIGSLAWASPEQAQGLHDELDTRTDVYSLGVILYFVLTERFPYSVEGDPRAVLDRIIRAAPVKCGAVALGCHSPAGRIDSDVETIVHKCLEKDRTRRYSSAGDLAADIRRYLAGDPLEAKRDSRWYVLRKTLRRHRLPVAIAAAFLLLILCGTVISTVFWQRAEREAGIARAERDNAERIASFMENILGDIEGAGERGYDTKLLSELMDAAAKRIRDGELAEAPPAELRLRLNVAHVYRQLLEYDAAHQMLDGTEEMALRSYGSDHAQMAETLATIADLQLSEGDREGAARRLAAALGIYERIGAAETEDMAWKLFMLGSCLCSLGRHDEALTRYQHGLAIAQRVLKPDEPAVLRGLRDVATELAHVGRPVEALPIYDALLPILERPDGGHEWRLARGLLGLGHCLRDLGREAESLSKYEAGLSVMQRLHRDEHRDLAGALAIVAEGMRKMGRFPEAETHARRAVGMFRAHPQWSSSQRAADSEWFLAHILSDAGDIDGAIASLREYVALPGPDTLDGPILRWSGETILAWTLLQRGQPGDALEAERLMRECAAAIPESHLHVWMRHAAISLHGEALSAQARFSEAESLLVDGYEGLKNARLVPQPAHIGLDFKGLALGRIVRLYDAWHAAEPTQGFDARADQWRAALDQWQTATARTFVPSSAKSTEVDAAERAPPNPSP